MNSLTDADLQDWELSRKPHLVQAIIETGLGTYALHIQISGRAYAVPMVETGVFDMGEPPVEYPYVEANSIDDIRAWLDMRLSVWSRCRATGFHGVGGYEVVWELGGKKVSKWQGMK